MGGIAAGTRALADLALPPLPATLLAVAAALVVTGALHEDGLADVADAIGAHTTRQRRLEILKDPRIGTFGGLALIVAIGLSTTTIAALDTREAVKALVISHTLSRWAILPVSRALRPAKPGGAGSLLRVTTPTLIAASAIAVAVAVALGGAAALAAAVIAVGVSGLVLNTTLGGITGDGYGADRQARRARRRHDTRRPMDLDSRGEEAGANPARSRHCDRGTDPGSQELAFPR